jgi:hypothetical protein
MPQCLKVRRNPASVCDIITFYPGRDCKVSFVSNEPYPPKDSPTILALIDAGFRHTARRHRSGDFASRLQKRSLVGSNTRKEHGSLHDQRSSLATLRPILTLPGLARRRLMNLHPHKPLDLSEIVADFCKSA